MSSGRRLRLGPTATPEERFWQKVEKTETCWLWIGAKTGGGYGTFAPDGQRTRRAHRVSYEWHVGAIPVGLDLDHLCRVRACVNPAHLEPVTRRVNLLRGETDTARRSAQTHCVHGHEFTLANTYHPPSGGRACRACNRERAAARRAAL